MEQRAFTQKKIHTSTQMFARDITRYCAVNDDAERLLETAINKLGLSTRAYSRESSKPAAPSPTSPARKKSSPLTSPRRFNIEVRIEDYRIRQQKI